MLFRSEKSGFRPGEFDQKERRFQVLLVSMKRDVGRRERYSQTVNVATFALQIKGTGVLRFNINNKKNK